MAVTPGATTAVVVRNTLARGKRGGLAAAAGAAAGNTVQAAVAGLGVAVLLARWPAAAMAIRLCGGAYLLWLGAVSLRRAMWEAPLPDVRNAAAPAAGKSFRQGLTVNLLNPAITSFYVGVLPAFMPAGAGRAYYAFLAAAHITIAFGCHAAWTLAFDRLRRHAERPQVRRALDALAGIVLIALAVQVLLAAEAAAPR
ncbi:MAG TPA: LysE family translocator [Vicinamibacterales bacterium]